MRLVDAKYKSQAVGALTFCYTLVGTVSVTVNAALITSWSGGSGEETNPIVVGKVIAISTCVPCFLSAFVFYRGGIFYAQRLVN